MTEVIIRLLDLPYNTKAFTAVDGNGDYNLYINARYSHETQRIAHDHEMTHISQDHFHRDSDVIQDELEADDLKPISTQPQPKLQPEYPVYSPPPVPQPDTSQKQTPHPLFADLRKKSGLTTQQVAKLAGIRHSSYVNYELGIRPCPPSHQTAILHILDKYR